MPRAVFLVLLVATGALVVPPPGSQASEPPQGNELWKFVNAFPDAACVDDTTAGFLSRANEARTNDTTGDIQLGLVQAVGTRATYVGMNEVFDEVALFIATAGSGGGGTTWTYSKAGGAWGALSIANSTSFLAQGTARLEFGIPGDWAKTSLGGGACGSGSYYFVKIDASDSPYDVAPLASQIGVVTYNLRVKVQRETGEPALGFRWFHFHAREGGLNGIEGTRDLGGGVYELALRASNIQSDTTYRVWSGQGRWLSSAQEPTPQLTTNLTDLTHRILEIRYPLRISVHDQLGDPVEGATVRLGGAPPDRILHQQYFYLAPASGPLVVSKAGYRTSDATLNADFANVTLQGLARTEIVLSGQAPCSALGLVDEGAEALCQGLFELPGAGTNGAPPASGPNPSPTAQGPATTEDDRDVTVQPDPGRPGGPDLPLADDDGGLDAGLLLWGGGALGLGALLVLLAFALGWFRPRPPDEGDPPPES